MRPIARGGLALAASLLLLAGWLLLDGWTRTASLLAALAVAAWEFAISYRRDRAFYHQPVRPVVFYAALTVALALSASIVYLVLR